jgi:curved DNA-binding protein
MEFQDYYKILGLSKDASQKEIHRAYRKLARKYHPDVNKGKTAEEKFKKINEANEVLKDPEKRKLYDTYGKNWQQAGSQPPPHWDPQRFSKRTGRQGFSQSFHFGDNGEFKSTKGFSDFFESLFGGETANRHNRSGYDFDMPGRSHEAEMSVSLADVCHGATKAISFQTYETDGSGQVRSVTRTLNVKIPRGITNGAVIRLAGQGDKGVGQGVSGDLLLQVNIAPDPRFQVDGHDLHTIVPISPWEAALGGKVKVQTVDGAVTLSIPKGSQNGRKLRIRGKGIPKNDGAAGDIIVQLEIRIPDHLTNEEDQLLRELSTKSKFNPRDNHYQRAGSHG